MAKSKEAITLKEKVNTNHTLKSIEEFPLQSFAEDYSVVETFLGSQQGKKNSKKSPNNLFAINCYIRTKASQKTEIDAAVFAQEILKENHDLRDGIKQISKEIIPEVIVKMMIHRLAEIGSLWDNPTRRNQKIESTTKGFYRKPPLRISKAKKADFENKDSFPSFVYVKGGVRVLLVPDILPNGGCDLRDVISMIEGPSR